MKIKKIIIFSAAMALLLSVPFTYGADIKHIVIATIPVGDLPQRLGVNPNTNRIYVANLGDIVFLLLMESTIMLSPPFLWGLGLVVLG